MFKLLSVFAAAPSPKTSQLSSYALALRCLVQTQPLPIVLQICYALSGPKAFYLLRVCYAQSGTDVGYLLRNC
eukprot:1459053-Rhodomonas_salina.1